ncbi:MAG TPA: hypothetical protein VHD35_15915 [Chitinophagaceae bacterium]|nr:hypothetical protein [Chitinophagaceae bacterium]
MNYIKHLTGFFDLVVKDERLNPTHISLYVALFQYWNVNRFKNPISISRSETMKVSKISAKGTYHKCMKELHEYGYIKYDPSYNPFRGSLVHLVNFENGKARPNPRQVLNKDQSGDEQALTPSLNSTNNSNKNKQGDLPPLSDIENFFREKKYPAAEAKKFYNHYKAIGWKIQGITPIKDWQALAEKWMQNAKKWELSSAGGGVPTSRDGGGAKDLHYLYDTFLDGKNIFKHITPSHFDQLKLELTEEILQQAWQERINQLTGSNQNSVIQLWKAYLAADPNNELVIKDKPNLIALAKRITVLKHFYSLKQSGAKTCHPACPPWREPVEGQHS